MIKSQSLKSDWEQLELLEYKPSVEELRQEVKTIYERNEKVRKSLYARQSAIEFKNQLIEKELEFLKAAICRG